MTKITVEEQIQFDRYLIISRKDEEDATITSRILISDENTNRISVVNIEQGPVGDKGEKGDTGPAGKDAASFDILPITSGGTNNNSYTSGNIIYFDGTQISSSDYSIQDILNEAALAGNAITGILAGSGLSKTQGDNTVTLDVSLGEGLEIGPNNQIVVDGSIARTAELDLGQIEGQVPISKGGTNNNFFTQNRLVYFDGTQIKSFPIPTGDFVFSGANVNIIAGSGLIGGGSLDIPDGSVVINIPSSSDIFVEDNLVSLTPTGTAGTYSKVTTDSKGRVIQGSSLTEADIITILGYTPFHLGNDGSGSFLDADLLDGQHGSYYTDAGNLTGLINTNIIPSAVEPGTYTKVGVDSNGLVTSVLYADQSDIISSLGYTPVPTTGSKTIYGDTTLEGNTTINGELEIYDHLPLLATDNPDILPDTPRGISFVYGGLFSNKTGLLAYYPAQDELRLVTNVFASGADIDGDGDSDYQDDINGGNAQSVFVLQNLDGDASTILLKNIADTLYVKTSTDENINGLKTFLDGITVKGQIQISPYPGNPDPPLELYGNNNKVIDLNADLLDGEHKEYYNDASNMTGSFSYDKVTFDHIEGIHNYIPKFNDTINDPAGRIDSSSLRQDNQDNLIVDPPYNLSIGTGNNNSASSSLNVGFNRITSSNSLAVGQGNTVNGNNSVALNYNSTANAMNSLALGNHGIASLPNQIAVGAFNVNDSSGVVRLEHGQYTTINMHMVGTEIGNNWTNLTPSIQIPQNKTVAYQAEVLITKAFGTGVAHYKLESGIFKNATFRDSNNIVDIINVTTHPQRTKKNELFNNSQIKNHYHTFEHSNGSRSQQDVRINNPPLQKNTLISENVKNNYRYTKVNKHISGVYYKTNDGNLILDTYNPVYDASFSMDTSNRGIKITSKDHGVYPNSTVDIIFSNITGFPIKDGRYKAYSVINADTFFIERPFYTGYLSYSSGTENYDYAHININSNSIVPIDNFYVDQISGNINSQGLITNLSNSNNLIQNLRIDSPIIIRSGNILFNRLVSASSGNRILVNDPIATGTGSQTQIITGNVDVYQIDFSFNLFKNSSRLYIDFLNGGVELLSTDFTGIYPVYQGREDFVGKINIPSSANFYTTGVYELTQNQNVNSIIGTDYNHRQSILLQNLKVPKQQFYTSGIPIRVLPLLYNSGDALLQHKKSASGSFITNPTVFDYYNGIYIRNKDELQIFNSELENIDLRYVPISYELVSGYKDDDNNVFEIENINNQYFLKNRYKFNYENKNVYYLRIKATDRGSNKFLEKYFTITVNNKRDPYKLNNIPDQTVDIGDIFNYTIPSNVFNEEENEGSLSYKAALQNGKDLPHWLNFDSQLLNFSGLASGCDLGTYNIRVFAENNFSEIYQDFYLTVRDQSVQVFQSQDSDTLDITDISVSSYSIDENLPSGSVIGKLDFQGSYRPYLEFITAQNNFTGILQKDSDIFEAQNIVYNYPTADISSDIAQIPINGLLENNNLPTDSRVVNIYKPFALSGTPGLSDGKIHFVDSYHNNNLRFFSGLKVYASEPLLLPNFTIQSFNDYSIFVGDRIALSTELDTEFPELIKTEDNDVLVTRYSNIRDTLLATEDSENTEQEDETGYIIANDRLDTNVVWASGYPGCNDAALIENQLVSFTPRARDYQIEINTTGNLDNFNPPPQSGLKRSNINYRHDSWSFRDKIENPVLALYGIGSGDLCTLLSEDNNLINDENNNDIISNNENHHGTRINLNTTYELFENYRVVKDNGKLLVNKFDQFITENGDPIVHDYAIAARSGDVCILFPGERQGNIDFYYDESSSSLLKENTDDLLYRDGGSLIIEHTLYDFYYNWGKLIQFAFTNDKYHVKINKIYTGNNNIKTRIIHNQTLSTNNNYNIGEIKTYIDYINSGNCPEPVSLEKVKGFLAEQNLNNLEYATGLVNIYTLPGKSKTTLNFNRDVNFDDRYINRINLHSIDSNHSLSDLPTKTEYLDHTTVSANTIEIDNYFFMPESGNSSNGSFVSNLDLNHDYVEESSTIINRVPVEFSNKISTLIGTDNNVLNRPKDYIFDIDSIDGNKILVKDNLNYLLKESGRPDYFEQAIEAEYLTNGIKFSGSLFHNDSNIYDIRYNFYALDNIYENITFEYDHSSKLFSFVIDSGVINPFDEIVVSFPTGFAYSSDPIADLITEDKILSRRYLHDLEPYKDNILLESSQSIDATDNTDQITITGQLSAGKDAQGTCTVNNNLTHRLQSGLLINHSGSSILGHQIDSFVSGFNFDGVIPKNNNVISTNIENLINHDHIGHASIFGTGNFALYAGARILRKATSNDIGFSEYYLINTNAVIRTVIPPQYWWQSPQVSTRDLTKEDLGGVGSISSPYRYTLQSSGLNPDKKEYIEFVYLGQNHNKLTIQGKYSVSGDLNRLNIYQTTFEEQTQRYRDSINREIPVFDTKVFTTGTRDTTDIVDYLDLTLDIKRFDKIKIELLPSSGNQYINSFDFTTFIVSGVAIKPYILESSSIINTSEDYYPYINKEDPSLVYTPVPTLDINDCIDCNTNLPQYIPAIDPEYSQFDRHKFYILPYIKTNNKYCGNDYEKNKQIFFNGNIIEISNLKTIKSYLIEDDELEIRKFNNISISDSGVTKHIHKYNSTNESTIISGITIEGIKNIPPKSSGESSYSLLFQDQFRFNAPLGVSHNTSLNNTGTIQFIRSSSGNFNILDYNNIYYHTYGGDTSHYPLDINGKLVPPAQTGTYAVLNNTKLCESGTLCVRIEGYNINRFTGIPDIRDRKSFGQQPNTINITGIAGRIRPFGVDKKMFFDFDDGFPEITDSYYIEDMIEPNVISINIPYNSNYINKSGLAYIIDSDQNIKSHLNPNLDNLFNVSNGSLQGLNSVQKKILNYYDHDTKRWKHTIHFKGNQPSFTGYNVSLSDASTRFISLNPNKIRISGIEYSFDQTSPTFLPLQNNTLIIPDNVSEIAFRVVTLDGDQNLFNSQRFSTPRISMSGIGSYRVEFDEPLYYGWRGKGWNIGLKWQLPAEDFDTKDILVRVSDFTGFADQPITITKYPIPEIQLAYTGYATTGSSWQITFDVLNIDLDSGLNRNDISLTLNDTPNNNFTILYVDDRSVVYSGEAGNQTGIFNPSLIITDLTQTPYLPIATGTGSIMVLNHISEKPTFDLQTNNLLTNYYLNIENQDLIKFDIPALLGPDPIEVKNNLNITLNHNSDYRLTLLSSLYNNQTKRFEVIILPQNTGDTNYKDTSGRYLNQSVSISLKQPVYDEFGNYIYQTYSNSFGFNVILYKPVVFQPIINGNTLKVTTDNPWTTEFYILSGVCEHDENHRPNARIFNTPNIGFYENNPIEYDLNYEYDSNLKKWKVSAISTKDAFDKYIDNTGLYNISIYAEDNLTSSFTDDRYFIEYSSIKELKNVSPNVYGTPNNEFFTKADSYDLNYSIVSNDISFPSFLKEDSINLNTTSIKYDKDLSLWQYSYIGEKMLDKYDVRFNITNNNIALQCKGIGKDKLIAVAKVDTLEIESNELQGLPLTITGILGYDPDPNSSGLIVDQGTEGWSLQFKTIGGLAHPNYPPTIVLENMPTACSGFNPLIDTQMQCVIKPPKWDPNDFGGSWSYVFSGLPSCTLLGRKDFSITAIDTNTGLLPDNPYLPDDDRVDYRFTYVDGQFSGTPPQIIDSPLYPGMGIIRPLCNTLYKKQYDFGPTESLCVITTGIKSYEVSGSLPSGLDYSIFFPEDGDTPVSPYSNLGSGYLLIEGYPQTFGPYSEKFALTVTDGRDLSFTREFTFQDSVEPNDADIGIAVFFENEKAALSPNKGKGFIIPNTVNWRPPPIEEALECRSVLPQNNCNVVDIVYSGTLGIDTKVYIIQPQDDNDDNNLANGSIIYLAVDDFNNQDINGAYVVNSNSNGLYIEAGISLNVQSTGTGTVVKAKRDSTLRLDNYDNFFSNGSLIENTRNCLVGGGRIDTEENSTNPRRALLGMLAPSFKTSVSGLTAFRSDNSVYSGLKFDRINNNTEIISSVSWSDCWQTGTVYLSGIVVPSINAEIIDPPPAQDYYFSFNGVRFALATKLVFGDNEIQKLLPENERSGKTLKYQVKDILNNTTIQNGSVSSSSSFDTNILTKTSGTVYNVSIEHESDTFPTYNYGALPYSKNEYIWIHKGANLSDIPIQNTFPPVITAGFDSISVINDLHDSEPNGIVMEPIIGLAIGGYVPDDAGIGINVPLNSTGSPSEFWSTSDFMPILSGSIQRNLGKNSVSGTANYAFVSTYGQYTVTIKNANVNENDIISLKLYSSSNQLRNTKQMIVQSDNIESDGDFVYFEDLGSLSFNGYAIIDFGFLVEDIDFDNNMISIRHSGLSLPSGHSVCVDKNSYVSTELGLLSNPGVVSVASGDSEFLYITSTSSSKDWQQGFASGDFVSLYENIDDNIKIMPYNNLFINEGRFAFQITGRSNILENETLTYKISTMENPNMPIFDTGNYPNINMTPKKYFQNYPLYVNKPISIVSGSVVKNGNTLSFSVLGGKRPIQDNAPDVQIAAGTNPFSYCGFFRNSISDKIQDEYDEINDRLNISLDLNQKYGIDWSEHNSLRIKISDETGSNEFTYNY